MPEPSSDVIRVEVVYAEPGHVFRRELVLPAGSSLARAVDACALAQACPEIELGPDCFGVFGQRMPTSYELRDGDRVEIYRPLQADPMDARRRRAGKAP